MSIAAPAISPRIPQLDGVRGIAITFVIVWHYFTNQVVAAPWTMLWCARKATSLTWTGVDLFFILSGFLIGGILLDNKGAPNYFRTFYLRRTFRIFPVYFLLLGSFVLFSLTPLFLMPEYSWLTRNAMPLWSYATFTQNFFMGTQSFGANWLGITWSLAVEEQFYLIVPFLVYFLPKRALVCTLVALILLAPTFRSMSPGMFHFVMMPMRADSLLSGVLLAILVRWEPFLPVVKRHQSILLTGLVVLSLGALTMNPAPIHFGALNYLWISMLYTSFVLLAYIDAVPLVSKFTRSPVLIWLGRLSYGIYMYHQLVCGLLHGYLIGSAPRMASMAQVYVTLLALVVTLILAYLSFKFIESPLLKYASRFKYQPPVPKCVPSAAEVSPAT